MSDIRVCAECGAEAPRSDTSFCGFCGAELPTPDDSNRDGAGQAPLGDVEARFRALESNPALAQLMQRQPNPGARTHVARGLAFGVSFVLLMLLVAVLSAAFFPPLLLLPLAALAIGLYALTSTLLRQRRANREPLEHAMALVMDLRTSIQSGGDTVGRSQHVARLRFADGSEREVRVESEEAGDLAAGDLGVAFLRAARLVGFAQAPED